MLGRERGETGADEFGGRRIWKRRGEGDQESLVGSWVGDSVVLGIQWLIRWSKIFRPSRRFMLKRTDVAVSD